jgi:hypothetical protein
VLLPWDVAAECAAGLAVVTAAGRVSQRPRAVKISAFTGEIAVVLGLYALWQWAGTLGQSDTGAAFRRGEALYRFEQALHWPSELSVERVVLPHAWLSQAFNIFYMTVHVAALVVFLVWLFVRHRPAYPTWRNTGAALTGVCLAIQFISVAPPRLMPHLGFIDMAAFYGQSVYNSGGVGADTQVAAMPSVHVGWAAFIAIAVIAVSQSRWRWLVLAHPIITVVVVVATANHWWIDGVVALALIPVAYLAQAVATRIVSGVVRAGRRVVAAPPRPASEGTRVPIAVASRPTTESVQ